MPELCDWPISYAACGAVTPPPIEPATLVWPNGQRVDLTRVGDVVTARIYPNGVDSFSATALPIPESFWPVEAGQYQFNVRANYVAIANRTEGEGTTLVIGGIDAGPYLEGDATWLAEPISPLLSTGCKALDDLGASERQAFEAMAAQMLWHWTGEVFGVCEVVTRPCRSNCSSAAQWRETFWGNGPYPWRDGIDSGSWVPMLIGGQWYNMGCGCAGTCNCAEEGPNALRLPGPVVSITQVRIDGAIVDPSKYQVLYNRLLVRTDGANWPSCQNLMTDAGQENTFEVTYKRGVDVPIGGQVAAGVLACELAKAACNDGTCQLPKRIQSLTRQGVTIGFTDDFRGLDDGRTGVWLIDSWTASVKAPQAKAHAGVRSPDTQRSRGGITTWPRT